MTFVLIYLLPRLAITADQDLITVLMILKMIKMNDLIFEQYQSVTNIFDNTVIRFPYFQQLKPC